MGEGLARPGLGLSDFVLVVREDEILAAGVQVKTFAQLLHRHDRTFDVPAWAARANARIPRGFAGFRSFPEGEIAGTVLVVFVEIDAGAVFQIGEIFL